jgi:hypothetical protein
VALEEFGIRIDRRKRVAHIVGYQACHHANLCHPLCLHPLVLCTLLQVAAQSQTSDFIEHEDIAAV